MIALSLRISIVPRPELLNGRDDIGRDKIERCGGNRNENGNGIEALICSTMIMSNSGDHCPELMPYGRKFSD